MNPRLHPCIRSLVAAVAIAAVALTACASTESGGDGDGSERSGAGDDVIHIVATTNVWGDIAAGILGDRGEVTPLLADLARDPHDYEPTGRDELALSRADLVVVNGGGYDDVVDQMLGALDTEPAVVRAVDLVDRSDGNEHVWFDPAAATAVATGIAAELAVIDPGHADDFTDRATAFADSLTDVRKQLAEIARQYPGTPVAVAEPLPVPLIEAAGMANIIGDSFTEAMEEGIDVPPAELAAVLDRLGAGEATMLIYNVQSTTAQSEQVRRAAEDAGTPVIEVTELLPPDTGYRDWIGGIVDDIAAHLGVPDAGSVTGSVAP